MSANPLRKLVVKTLDGSSLPRCKVVCSTSSSPAHLKGTVLEGGTQTIHADRTGQCDVNIAENENVILAVAGEIGFGFTMSCGPDNQLEIVVHPWGRLCGSWINRGHPVSNRVLRVGFMVPKARNAIWLGEEIKTDGNGEFVFEHVPPTALVLSVQHEHPEHPWFGALEFFEAHPGETKQLTVITRGRTVSGQLELDGAFQCGLDRGGNCCPDWSSCYAGLTPVLDWNELQNPTPPRTANTLELLTQWWLDFERSDVGIRRRKAKARLNIIAIERNGMFSADLVEPGEYRFNEFLTQDNKPIGVFDQKPFMVTDCDGPVALGKIQIARLVELNSGDLAPNIHARTLGGQPLSLFEFKGRFVLLNFTAHWCHFCIQELPYIQSVYETYKNDPRLVILSVHFDSDQKQVEQFIASNNARWSQVLLDKPEQEILSRAYGIVGVPIIRLIGPDGRLASAELRGPQVLETVRLALPSAA